MIKVKCNKCSDEFELDKQDKWNKFCFHCGKGVLIPIINRSYNRISKSQYITESVVIKYIVKKGQFTYDGKRYKIIKID